jgi:hypothetical protein
LKYPISSQVQKGVGAGRLDDDDVDRQPAAIALRTVLGADPVEHRLAVGGARAEGQRQHHRIAKCDLRCAAIYPHRPGDHVHRR